MCQTLQHAVYTTSNHHIKGQPAHHQEAPQAEERGNPVHNLRGSPGHQDNQTLLSPWARQCGPNLSKTPRHGGTPPPHCSHKSLCQCHQDPALWKVGRIIPILKPGKPANQSKSYRSIALLSPVAMLLERLLIPHLQKHLPLADHQHGFRKGRSTITALNCIVHNISTGLNRPKQCERTMLVALDLTSAFNTVDHSTPQGHL